MGEGVVDVLAQINMLDEEEEGVGEGSTTLENSAETFHEEIEGHGNNLPWESNQSESEEVSKWSFPPSKLTFLPRKAMISRKLKAPVPRVKKGHRLPVLPCLSLPHWLLEVTEHRLLLLVKLHLLPQRKGLHQLKPERHRVIRSRKNRLRRRLTRKRFETLLLH